MQDKKRAALAEAQESFVKALLGQGPAPDGFDIDKLTHAGASLAHKRQRDAAKRAVRPEVPTRRRPRWWSRLIRPK